ncbi:MAG: ABC transporter ATP-binding protein [Candidatus Cloacimonadota bacterium]|nr:ABC transporter ATP-binding protein [Candidatus Cloacimonadota bacterium]
MSSLEIQNLSFRYSNNQPWIVRNFSFEAEKGDIVAVQGPSGSGKTTFLYLLCGVIPKIIKGEFGGKIKVMNENIENLSLPQIAPKLSLMMQETELQLSFPSVEQELAFAPENLKLTPSEIENRIDDALTLLQIKSLRYEETATLSFGQKKLVAFASILTLSPQIFLLDEPTSGLSSYYIQIIINVISKLSHEGKTIFIANPSPELLKISNKVIDLDNLQE